MERNDDPFFKYSVEELQDMSHEEFCAVIEESNEYVRRKHSQASKQEMPRFNTIEEFREYYDCIPFEEAVIRGLSLLSEEDRYIEQCRRELEARIQEINSK